MNAITIYDRIFVSNASVVFSNATK